MYQSLLEKAITAKENSKVTLTVNQYVEALSNYTNKFLWENVFIYSCIYV